jgi:hypothetical protein
MQRASAIRTRRISYTRRNSFARPPATIESLEERRLMSISTWQSDSISDITDYSYFDTVMAGSNGDADSTPGLVIGDAGGDTATMPVLWDSTPSNGFDSGWVWTQFSIMPSDDITELDATVGNGSMTHFVINSTTELHSVTIQAAVQRANMSIAWQNLDISFYHNGELAQEDVRSAGPSASTMNSTATTKESGLVDTFNGTGCDMIIVTGQVRLAAASGNTPVGNGLFSMVYVS